MSLVAGSWLQEEWRAEIQQEMSMGRGTGLLPGSAKESAALLGDRKRGDLGGEAMPTQMETRYQGSQGSTLTSVLTVGLSFKKEK